MTDCTEKPRLERIENKLDSMTELMVDNAEIHQTLQYQNERLQSVEKKVDRIYSAPVRVGIAIFVGVAITVVGAIFLGGLGLV